MLAFAGAVWADVVETKTGARVIGKIKQIDGTTVAVNTDYAGTVKIKQSEVTSISTDTTAHLRLSSGSVLQGTLTGMGSGAVIINSPDGSIQTNIDKIITTWASDAKDPEIVSLQRAWSYQAGVDIVGKSGNSDQLGTGFSFRATLNGAQDKLQFYSAYDRQVTEKQKSADQLKAGADFQNNFSARNSWYLRDEAGFDRVKLIQFSNVTAVGLGYDFIKKPKQTFTIRTGIAHRFESYNVDPAIAALYPTLQIDEVNRLATKESINSAGLDLGLVHSLELNTFSIVNRLSIIPAFDDFADYRAQHESFLELPLVNASWKVRFGLTNDYTSKPAQGKRRLDTTYFTHLVLNWR